MRDETPEPIENLVTEKTRNDTVEHVGDTVKNPGKTTLSDQVHGMSLKHRKINPNNSLPLMSFNLTLTIRGKFRHPIYTAFLQCCFVSLLMDADLCTLMEVSRNLKGKSQKDAARYMTDAVNAPWNTHCTHRIHQYIALLKTDGVAYGIIEGIANGITEVKAHVITEDVHDTTEGIGHDTTEVKAHVITEDAHHTTEVIAHGITEDAHHVTEGIAHSNTSNESKPNAKAFQSPCLQSSKSFNPTDFLKKAIKYKIDTQLIPFFSQIPRINTLQINLHAPIILNDMFSYLIIDVLLPLLTGRGLQVLEWSEGNRTIHSDTFDYNPYPSIDAFYHRLTQKQLLLAKQHHRIPPVKIFSWKHQSTGNFGHMSILTSSSFSRFFKVYTDMHSAIGCSLAVLGAIRSSPYYGRVIGRPEIAVELLNDSFIDCNCASQLTKVSSIDDPSYCPHCYATYY